MVTKNDIDLIEEYEELIVLLRQLHDDVPILEKQHNSIKKAFKNAQEKLDSTIKSSEEEMRKNAVLLLDDFEKECQKVVNDIFLGFQKQVEDNMKSMLEDFKEECKNLTIEMISDFETRSSILRKEITLKEKNINALLEKAETNSRQVYQSEESTKRTTSLNSAKNTQLAENLVCVGRTFYENYRDHINKDLIVKRIQPAKKNAWDNDYCMFITEIKDNYVYGDIYLNGNLIKTRTFYSDSDFFITYKSPNKEKILRSRDDDELPF